MAETGTDLILVVLRLDQKVVGLTGGNALAWLEGLERLQGNGDLTPRLAGGKARIVDHQVTPTSHRWHLIPGIGCAPTRS